MAIQRQVKKSEIPNPSRNTPTPSDSFIIVKYNSGIKSSFYVDYHVIRPRPQSIIISNRGNHSVRPIVPQWSIDLRLVQQNCWNGSTLLLITLKSPSPNYIYIDPMVQWSPSSVGDYPESVWLWRTRSHVNYHNPGRVNNVQISGHISCVKTIYASTYATISFSLPLSVLCMCFHVSLLTHYATKLVEELLGF